MKKLNELQSYLTRLRGLMLTLIILCSIGTTNVWGADVTDEITASNLAATGTTYTNFSGVTITSDAVYAGNSALNNNTNIQLRSKNSNSGIVSTASGGSRVKSVRIVVASGSNIIKVYGKTTAYSAATDLYNNSTKGTEIGSTSSTATLTITGDYTFVGIRSNDGAVYISSIEITWETTAGCSGTALSTPSVTATPSSNKLVLSWPNVDNATKYQVSWNGGAYADATSPFTKNSLSNGTTYTWAVKAIGDESTWCNSEAAEGSSIPGTYYTVTFMNNGETYATKSIRSGTNLILPDNPSTCDVSKEFVGWSTTNIGSTPTNTKPTFVSTQTTISSAQTYYAVFATKTANKYVLGSKTDLIDDRKVLIVNPTNNSAMSGTNSSGKLTGTSISISSSTITNSSTSIIWTVKPQADGKYKFIYGGNELYATANNSLYCNASNNDSWTVTANGSHYILTSALCSKNLEYYSGFTVFNTNTTAAYQMDFYIPEYKNYITSCCTAPATALSITGANTVAMDATLSPGTNGGNGGTITWSVVNGTGSATINSSTGVLTPTGVGTVTIKAHQDANDKCAQDAEKVITILAATVNVTGVSVDPTTKAIVVGETFTITPTVTPANATDKTVSWTTSASGKASVSNGTVTGVAKGSATITCTTTDGGRTATTAVTVYNLTVLAQDEDGTDISGVSGITASHTGKTLNAGVGSTKYVFKGWKYGTASGTAIASASSSSTTLTGAPTGDITVIAEFYKPVTVTWLVGSSSASGSPTTSVKRGSKITALPSTPADNAIGACANKFKGWSATSELIGTGNSAPADLFTSASDAGVVALTSPTTYRAVFATSYTTKVPTPNTYTHTIESKTWDGTGSQTLTSKSWSLSNNGGYYGYDATKGQQVGSGSSPATSMTLSSSAFSGTITSVKISTSGASSISATVGVSVGSTDFTKDGDGSTKTASLTSTNTEYTFSGSATGTITISWAQTSSKAIYFKKIVVGYTTMEDGTDYKDYVTQCCANNVTLSGGSPSNGTVTFSPAGPIATCSATAADRQTTMTITPNAGYKLTGWSTTGVTPASVSPAVATSGDDSKSAQAITVTFTQNTTTGTYTANATFTAMVDHFIDKLHETTGYTESDNHAESAKYTVPNLSDKSAPSDETCEQLHYKFVGWVAADDVDSDGTLIGSPTILTGGTTNHPASDKTYWAIWAKEL